MNNNLFQSVMRSQQIENNMLGISNLRTLSEEDIEALHYSENREYYAQLRQNELLEDINDNTGLLEQHTVTIKEQSIKLEEQARLIERQTKAIENQTDLAEQNNKEIEHLNKQVAALQRQLHEQSENNAQALKREHRFTIVSTLLVGIFCAIVSGAAGVIIGKLI